MKTNDAQSDELQAVLADLLKCRVITLERIGGGKNSQVYHLISKISEKEKHFAVKRYFRHPTDLRDRLGVEFSTLQYLWQNGLRCIPQPILAARDRDCAIYEYIEGEKLIAPQIGESEIDQAVEFLAALQELRDKPGSESLPPASEACFSIRCILDNNEDRLSRLNAVGHETPLHTEMYAFLNEYLRPALEAEHQHCSNELVRLGKTLDTELSQAQRILSPSDFGFHNALRRPDGQLIFLDFEYFGWDDPAKTIADILLHPNPAMDLTARLKERLTKELLNRFGASEGLPERLRMTYPLFCIKWCIILLNEFSASEYERRSFASRETQIRVEILASQLAKAIQLYKKMQECI